MTKLPQNGQTIIFTVIPAGSYISAGEAYRVDRPKNKGVFRFVSADRGSSAYARSWTLARSEWQVA